MFAGRTTHELPQCKDDNPEQYLVIPAKAGIRGRTAAEGEAPAAQAKKGPRSRGRNAPNQKRMATLSEPPKPLLSPPLAA